MKDFTFKHFLRSEIYAHEICKQFFYKCSKTCEKNM